MERCIELYELWQLDGCSMSDVLIACYEEKISYKELLKEIER